MEILVIRFLALLATEADTYISKSTGLISMEILGIRLLVVLGVDPTHISKNPLEISQWKYWLLSS